jgi:hypothetical protein
LEDAKWGLQDDLDDLRAESVRSAPAGRAELYDAKVDELRRIFPMEKTLKTGDRELSGSWGEIAASLAPSAAISLSAP